MVLADGWAVGAHRELEAGTTTGAAVLTPITAASRDRYESAPLGDAVPIPTPYNAWVDGLTGAKITGRRTLH